PAPDGALRLRRCRQPPPPALASAPAQQCVETSAPPEEFTRLRPGKQQRLQLRMLRIVQRFVEVPVQQRLQPFVAHELIPSVGASFRSTHSRKVARARESTT